MKRKLLFLILSLILVSGCTIEKLDSTNYLQTIELAISQFQNKTNVNAYGYSFYLPMGTYVKDIMDYNQIIYTGTSSYYLYVDIASYYYEIPVEYTKKDDIFFSETITTGEKQGYVEIYKYKTKYFIKMVLESSKMEAIVGEEKITQTLVNMVNILNSVTFNDTIINTIIGENTYNKELETFSIFEEKEIAKDFMEYIQEYDTYEAEEDEFPDYEETINIETEEE